MDNQSYEFIKEETNDSKHDIYSNIIQSDFPSKLISEKNSNIIYKRLCSDVLKKWRKSFLSCELIKAIIFYIFVFSYYGISFLDIIIQIINPNGLNPYLIDDILLILSSILYACDCEFKCKYGYYFMIFLIFLTFCCLVIDNTLFLQNYFEKNKNPKYIKEFYIVYITIKLYTPELFLSLLMLIFIILGINKIIRKMCKLA